MKLMRYALAGSAVLGMPSLSLANILGITQSGTVTATGANSPQFLPVYFDDPSQPDFLLVAEANSNAGQSYSTIFAYDPGGVATFSGPMFDGASLSGLFPTAFSSAGMVNANSVTGLSAGKLAKSVVAGGPSMFYGNFPSNGEAFLGVVFETSNGMALGTVDLSIQEMTGDSASATVTVLGSSYEDLPLASTPEPSYLPLFALGAAGLAIARKRRSGTGGTTQ